MNNNIATTQNVHIYKPKPWTHALNIFSLLFICIVMGLPITVSVVMLKSMLQAQSEFISLSLAFTCLFAPIIVLLAIVIIQMTMNVILSFFSYIKISPEGIEQKNAIYKHIRSNWSSIDKLDKYFLFRDAIYLNSFEVIGPSLSLKSPFRFLRPKQGFISLTGFKGWPEGELADDLKHYAPRLFEVQSLPERISEGNKNIPSKETPIPDSSQEDRLFAALSNASIIFSTPGIFVPIVIYATQRKKSAYVGFQAIQALYWQITAFIFSVLTSSCMVGAIFIPILYATASKNERFLDVSGGGIVIAMIASMFLMIFGNLAFVIYGLIGAVKTYRGKDFRYIFIGNRIKKSQGTKPT